MNTIIFTTKNKHLSEEQQYIKTKFFIVNKLEENLYEKRTPNILCRDFLNDVLYCITFNTSINIYNFDYDQTKENLNKENIYLCLKFTSKTQKQNFIFNFKFLSKLEKFYNLETFTSYEETNNYLTLLIKHHPIWFSNTMTLSFFTFILRCLCYPKCKENFWEFIKNSTYKYKTWNNTYNIINTPESQILTDNIYFKNFIINFKILTSNYKQQKFDSKYSIHNKSGFLSYLRDLEYSNNPLITTIKDITQCQEDVMDVIPY